MPIFNFNHRNADGGNFNCVFVSCGYLLNIDKSDVARHGKIAEPQSGGLQWSDVEKLAKNLADYMHVGYKAGSWPGGFYSDICENNDTTKFAVCYTRSDGTGHCVVYDDKKADQIKAAAKARGLDPTKIDDWSGFLDFQVHSEGESLEQAEGRYIGDHIKYYFLFKTGFGPGESRDGKRKK